MCIAARPFRGESSRTRGFTLVELLVVVAIIGTIMGLLLPAVQSARESSRRGACGNNLKQLALACLSHLTLIGHYPTGGCSASSAPVIGAQPDWRQPAGWCYTILPYLEMQNVYDLADATKNVPAFVCPTRRGSSLGPGSIGVMTDFAGNRGAWSANPSAASRVMQFGPVGNACPLDRDSAANVATAINATQAIPGGAVVTGGATSVPTGGIIFAGSALLPAKVRDGQSNTYLLGEKYVPSTQYATGAVAGYSLSAYVGDSSETLRGGHRLPETDASAWNSDLEGAFGGPHSTGFQAALCDGSVRFVGFTVNAGVHFVVAAREDRQPVQPPE